MPYKSKPLIIATHPWWHHPVFPWGYYSLTQDRIEGMSPLRADGYSKPGDGGGGKYEWVPGYRIHGDGGDTLIDSAMTGGMMETDWELGRPPFGISVEAWICGYVRRGFFDGGWFIFQDCTHPMQNMAVPVDWVTAFRARSPIAVIYNPMQPCYSPGWQNEIDGLIGSIFG